MTAPTDFIEVPSGALCSELMTLTCKGPDEERSYVIEYTQQLDPDDYIAATGFTYTVGDPLMSVTNVVSHGRRFRFTLNGGTLNMKSGITFVFPLVSGDIRELTFAITVEEQGVLQSGTVPVIMGAQGQRGVTLWTGIEDPTSSYTPPSGWAILTNDLFLNEDSNSLFQASVASDGTVTWNKIARLGNPLSNLPDGTYYVDQNNHVVYSYSAAELPDGVILNGGVYMVGTATLPTGLSSNGGVIMTDGSVYYLKTWNNNGVLCASGV